MFQNAEAQLSDVIIGGSLFPYPQMSQCQNPLLTQTVNVLLLVGCATVFILHIRLFKLSSRTRLFMIDLSNSNEG